VNLRHPLPIISLILCSALLSGCRQPSDPPAGGAAVPARAASSTATVQFRDVTEEAGIHFKHTNGRSGRLYLPETVGSGCAFLDYNNDGRLDLFLVNASRLPGYPGKGPFFSALYRNEGQGRFTDVTQPAGLAVECYGMGVAIADYNGDGFQDLYLTALGPNHLFRNNGDGSFSEVTQRAGVGDRRFSTSAAWFDYDRDGHLDLFVANYCHWSPQINKICPDSLGRKHLCGPTYYQGDPSTLYRNNGDGTFTDVTKKAGLYQAAGKALGVVMWDADDDGWLDLIMANDMEPNFLFRNNGDGTFTEQGVEAGVAYSNQGKPRAGMGIDTADTTNSGRESILIGNNTDQGLAQFLSDGQGHFTDVAEQTGLFEASLPFLTFGLAFVDYDGDGFKDIFLANGHVDENVHAMGDGISYPQPIVAFHNTGTGQFVPVGEQLGPIFKDKRVWRGLATGDYDGDGDLDLLVSACDGKPALLRNDGGNKNHWLQVRAVGAGGNRQGIGTKVTVEANGMRQTGWIRSGSSYLSSHDLVAWFGLGSASTVERINLRWPNGTEQTLTNVAADREIQVEQGRGLVERPTRQE
jgi:hypothetical protein